MRIAITGATGLVGHQVAVAAVRSGHEVVALTRPGRQRREPLPGLGAVRRVPVDLGRVDLLRPALEGVEGIVHCAAVYAYGASRAQEVARVNVDGTRSVLTAAAEAGVPRVVVTSSSVTCGSAVGGTPRTEADRLGDEPAPAYYASKVAQEEAALDIGARLGLSVVLALPTVVLGGPFVRLGPSNAIVLRYLLDPTRATFPGGCNVVDARDVGAGHLLLLERGTAGERYLLGGENVTWRALHTLVADLAGVPSPRYEAPTVTTRLVSAAAEEWARLTGAVPLSTREEAATVGRDYWYSSGKAETLGYAARAARAAVAASLAWLAVGPDLPRWVREGLRLHPDVRAARPLVPRELPREHSVGADPDPVSPGRGRSRPPRPRRPR